MSLFSPAAYIIPEDTEQAARASFPKGHPLMRIADEFGLLYTNSQFATLFSPTGQPALDPARLALVTVFQFMEGLSDEQVSKLPTPCADTSPGNMPSPSRCTTPVSIALCYLSFALASLTVAWK